MKKPVLLLGLLSITFQPLNADASFWETITSFFTKENQVLSKDNQQMAVFRALDFLALPFWKTDHEKWGWSNDISIQLFEGSHIHEKAIKKLEGALNRTQAISTTSRDINLVVASTMAHAALGDLLVISSFDSLNHLSDNWQSESLDDEAFIRSLDEGILKVIKENSWAKSPEILAAYNTISQDLERHIDALWVVDTDVKSTKVSSSTLNKLKNFFGSPDYDPLVNISANSTFFDFGTTLENKGFSNEDHPFWILEQLYEVVSDEEQLIFRVFVNNANKEAIADVAYNLYFFSGLVDTGWNPDISRIRKKVMDGIATTIVLKGSEAFSENPAFAAKLKNILDNAGIN